MSSSCEKRQVTPNTDSWLIYTMVIETKNHIDYRIGAIISFRYDSRATKAAFHFIILAVLVTLAVVATVVVVIIKKKNKIFRRDINNTKLIPRNKLKYLTENSHAITDLFSTVFNHNRSNTITNSYWQEEYYSIDDKIRHSHAEASRPENKGKN